MESKHILILTICLALLTVILILLLLIHYCKRRTPQEDDVEDIEAKFECKERDGLDIEDFIKFDGCDDLSIDDVLEAPGEVIGKSSYGTLYRASLVRSNALVLLRFLKPSSTLRMKEVVPVIELLGSIRHPNLVPLYAFYSGNRGEKLLLHPFYQCGTLNQIIRDGNVESHKWSTIHKISTGVVKGLCYLHLGLGKPLIHGNIKTENIFLDHQFHPYMSDFGMHLLLTATAGQQMLEASAALGYKAPELIKMREANGKCDIYSLGVIFLELLTGKESIDNDPSPDQDFYLPNAMRNAILDHRIKDLYHPDIMIGLSNDQRAYIEDCVLQFCQLAMACCSPIASLRPDILQVLDRLEEIGR
ncbi:transmembrane signal receptor [Lithospermum erythrorhizon]|uniref:Transmembrane signal receptor n=1 Tax=Lithospermum erythrorhizon TaxID=34254 RepID=A0AAV3Q646_LITER